MPEHESNFYSWTQNQAALLRAGKFTELDIANIIEELEDMGRSEKRELESRLAVLLMHLLKWQYQPKRQGNSWEATIRGQRYRIRKVLQENPGLKPDINETVASAYQGARIDAMGATNLPLRTFPIECPWTFEQAMADKFWP